MSIIRTEFPLQFASWEEHLTPDALNGAYGEHGLSYPTMGQAKAALAAMGFMPTATRSVWKKGDRQAFITALRESGGMEGVEDRPPESSVHGTYRMVGALITFGGNIPYLKV